ncbi:MAG: hypothetical protein IT385_03285 [Deltaproteobacteria bacterium]|nr:hypothetical protein [Deltaproteobacteria bacterium]
MVTLVVIALAALILGFAASAPAFHASAGEAGEPGTMGLESTPEATASEGGATRAERTEFEAEEGR